MCEFTLHAFFIRVAMFHFILTAPSSRADIPSDIRAKNKTMGPLKPYANRTRVALEKLRTLGVCDKTTELPWLDNIVDVKTEAIILEWAHRNYSKVEQFSFFHIPKCAGSSMTTTLVKTANECGLRSCAGSGRANVDTSCMSSNSPLVRGHQYIGIVSAARLRGLSAYYFTLLRHPVSRVISLHRYILSSHSHRLFKRVESMTLPEFAQSESVASNGMTRRLCGPKSGPVAAQCAADRTFALTRAKQHLLNEFAFVGLQECYDESIELVSHLLPWVDESKDGGGLEVLHENKLKEVVQKADNGSIGGQLSYSPVLSAEEYGEIVARNEWDMEVYEFGVRLFRASLLSPPTTHALPSQPTYCDPERMSRWRLRQLEKERDNRFYEEKYDQDMETPREEEESDTTRGWNTLSTGEKTNWKKEYYRRSVRGGIFKIEKGNRTGESSADFPSAKKMRNGLVKAELRSERMKRKKEHFDLPASVLRSIPCYAAQIGSADFERAWVDFAASSNRVLERIEVQPVVYFKEGLTS